MTTDCHASSAGRVRSTGQACLPPAACICSPRRIDFPTGQRPKPAFLQLSPHGELLRWSWRGRAVLVHEILSVHASRHPDFNTPCITLMLNSYGVAEGQRALDIVPNEATDYRVWMTGLQVRRDCRRDCPNEATDSLAWMDCRRDCHTDCL